MTKMDMESKENTVRAGIDEASGIEEPERITPQGLVALGFIPDKARNSFILPLREGLPVSEYIDIWANSFCQDYKWTILVQSETFNGRILKNYMYELMQVMDLCGIERK